MHEKPFAWHVQSGWLLLTHKELARLIMAERSRCGPMQHDRRTYGKADNGEPDTGGRQADRKVVP